MTRTLGTHEKFLVAFVAAWAGFLLSTHATPDLWRVALLSERFVEEARAVIVEETVDPPDASMPKYPTGGHKYRRVTYAFTVDGREIRGDWLSIRGRREPTFTVPPPRFFRGERISICYSRVVPGVNALQCDFPGAGEKIALFLYWFVSASLFLASSAFAVVMFRRWRREGPKP